MTPTILSKLTGLFGGERRPARDRRARRPMVECLDGRISPSTFLASGWGMTQAGSTSLTDTNYDPMPPANPPGGGSQPGGPSTQVATGL